MCCSCCTSCIGECKGKLIDINDTIEASGTIICHPTINIWFLLLRGIFLLTALGITIWSFTTYVIDGVAEYWFLYITHWGLILNVSYFICTFTITYIIYNKIPSENLDDNLNNNIPTIDSDILNLRHLWNTTLFFLDISLAYQIFIIILFWTLLFEPPLKMISLFTHGVSGSLMIIDWMISTWQLTYKGAFGPVIIAILWELVAVIFFFAGGTNEYDGGRYIYTVIDFENNAPLAIGLFIIMPILMFILHVLLVCIKNNILKCWAKNNNYAITDNTNSKGNGNQPQTETELQTTISVLSVKL